MYGITLRLSVSRSGTSRQGWLQCCLLGTVHHVCIFNFEVKYLQNLSNMQKTLTVVGVSVRL